VSHDAGECSPAASPLDRAHLYTVARVGHGHVTILVSLTANTHANSQVLILVPFITFASGTLDLRPESSLVGKLGAHRRNVLIHLHFAYIHGCSQVS
jgi:hypothetical protein